MTRRLTAVVVAAWFAAGILGTWSYAHDYILYRGFGAPRNPAGVAAGRLERVTFFSPALGTRRAYDIYLPPGYARSAARGVRFGVLYLLHGSPGTPRLFLRAGALGVALDTLVARRQIRPFLIVMPDGGDGSLRSDTEWADTGHGRYESFVLDVVRAVDRRWPTIADRAHRAIAGNSEGAYGAVNIALRHPGRFATVESWSGYFTQTPTGPFRRASAAQLRANSPAAYVSSLRPRLRTLPLRAFLYGGAQDPGTRQLGPFAAQLRAAGATVTTRVWRGRHDWRLWRDRTPLMLRFAARGLGAHR